MRPTLFEFAGGEPAFVALATAHHLRCVRDPELNHPFSHPDQHPQHVERLAVYWAEVMGGPPRYSTTCGDQSGVLRMHAGQGDMSELGRRFVDCFVGAIDDAGLPDDPGFRAALRAYMSGRWPTCSSTRWMRPRSRPTRGCHAGPGTGCRRTRGRPQDSRSQEMVTRLDAPLLTSDLRLARTCALAEAIGRQPGRVSPRHPAWGVTYGLTRMVVVWLPGNNPARWPVGAVSKVERTGLRHI